MQLILAPRSDGLLEPISDEALRFIKSQPPKPCVWELMRDRRTDNQNRYLNGWFYRKACELLNEAGYTVGGFTWTRDRLHTVCQQLFLVVEELPLTDGRISYRYESTAKMSKKRLTDYIDNQVSPWLLNDYEIAVPPPADEYYTALYRELYGE